MLPATRFPTPSKTEFRSTSRPPRFPASIGPPLMTIDGMFSDAAAIAMPGMILSVPRNQHQWRRARPDHDFDGIHDQLPARQGELHSSWFMAMPSHTPITGVQEEGRPSIDSRFCGFGNPAEMHMPGNQGVERVHDLDPGGARSPTSCIRSPSAEIGAATARVLFRHIAAYSSPSRFSKVALRKTGSVRSRTLPRRAGEGQVRYRGHRRSAERQNQHENHRNDRAKPITRESLPAALAT